MAYAVQATTRHQTHPEGPPGTVLPPKKVRNLGPMAPRSRKKRQLPRTSKTATAWRQSRRHRRGGAGPRRRRSSATRTRSRRCAAAPPSRGRRGGGPRPARPSSTWDRFTKRARRGPPRARRGAAVRRRRSTTTTRSTREVPRSVCTITTPRRVEPSTKPPGMPRRSSRRMTCRLLGISCSALPRIYI